MAFCFFLFPPIHGLELSFRSISRITKHHAERPNKLYIAARSKGFEHGCFTVEAAFEAVLNLLSKGTARGRCRLLQTFSDLFRCPHVEGVSLSVTPACSPLRHL